MILKSEVRLGKNMQTHEILRNEWRTFFDTFSRQHEGWLATIEVLGPDVGAQEEAHELPLVGVSLSSGGREAEAISIDVGTTPHDHVSHVIEEPAKIWLEQTDDGADVAMAIEDRDGTKTILRFRSAVAPEFVDGVVMDR